MADLSNLILKGIFVKLYQLDCRKIPIDQKSLDSQAKIFSEILDMHEINTGDTFNLTPVSESYFAYGLCLFGVISYNEMGLIDLNHNKIELHCSDYLCSKTLGKLEKYQKPINECVNSYLRSIGADYLIEDGQDSENPKAPKQKKTRETTSI